MTHPIVKPPMYFFRPFLGAKNICHSIERRRDGANKKRVTQQRSRWVTPAPLWLLEKLWIMEASRWTFITSVFGIHGNGRVAGRYPIVGW